MQLSTVTDHAGLWESAETLGQMIVVKFFQSYHLRLVRDKSSAFLHILARPPGILGYKVGTRKQTDQENSCKLYCVLHGGLLPHRPGEPGSRWLARGRGKLPRVPGRERATGQTLMAGGFQVPLIIEGRASLGQHKRSWEWTASQGRWPAFFFSLAPPLVFCGRPRLDCI
jgi:hypothetical protein